MSDSTPTSSPTEMPDSDSTPTSSPIEMPESDKQLQSTPNSGTEVPGSAVQKCLEPTSTTLLSPIEFEVLGTD